jgi:hypothetical protein
MATSAGTGAFRNGSTTSVAHTAFDPSIERMNSYTQGSASGGYQVRAGETLASIAANLWGDSSLWYKLAEANGLSGQAALSEGQSIRIPAGVMKNTHNASTFQPYDPADTIGDTAPTAAKPPKKNKCGAFGQVLLVVIAVAVSLITYNPATGAGLLSGLAGGTAAAGTVTTGTIAASVAAGAAGSIASQAVGVASGIQDKFSWNAVAMAGIGAGVGASGFGNAIASGASGRLATFISGAANNALSQGIGMAAGLQKKFSWAGVAAAGVGNVAFNAALGPAQNAFTGLGRTAGDIASRVGAGTASAVADAAARTAMGDGQFGDNFRAAIPNVIGQALGSVVGEKVAGWGNQQPDYVALAAESARAWEGYNGQNAGSSGALSFGAAPISGNVTIPDAGLSPSSGSTDFPSSEALGWLNRSLSMLAGYSQNAARRAGVSERVDRFLETGSMDLRMEPVTVTESIIPLKKLDRNVRFISAADGNVRFEKNGVIVTMNEQRYRDWEGARPDSMMSVAGSAIITNNDAHTKIAARTATFPLEFTVVGAAGFIATDVLEDGRITAGEAGRVVAEAALAKVGGKVIGDVAERIGAGVFGKIAAERLPKGTKLTFDRAAKSWTTPEGLIYGQGSDHGNRIKHILEHTVPNPNKDPHTLFNVARNQVLGLVDEAWAARGAPLPNDLAAYVVPMGRAVGQGGETSIKIVVRPGTTKVITAYPVR